MLPQGWVTSSEVSSDATGRVSEVSPYSVTSSYLKCLNPVVARRVSNRRVTSS